MVRPPGFPSLHPSTPQSSRMVDYQATKPIQHGGNQSAIRARLKLGNRPLVDFSAPLNALGPPPGAVAAVREATESIDRYPEPGSPRLVRRLAEYHGVPTDRIIVGAGTTELISLVGQVYRESLGRQPRRFSASRPNLWPTWSSLPTASTAGPQRKTACSPRSGPNTFWAGGRTPEPDAASGIFWTGHPNNPTGRAWDREPLLDLDRPEPADDHGRRRGVPAVFARRGRADLGSASAANRENLIVLRSMTKIYSFPGLRVGYAVASTELINRLKTWATALVGHHRRRGRRRFGARRR